MTLKDSDGGTASQKAELQAMLVTTRGHTIQQRKCGIRFMLMVSTGHAMYCPIQKLLA